MNGEGKELSLVPLPLSFLAQEACVQLSNPVYFFPLSPHRPRPDSGPGRVRAAAGRKQQREAAGGKPERQPAVQPVVGTTGGYPGWPGKYPVGTTYNHYHNHHHNAENHHLQAPHYQDHKET